MACKDSRHPVPDTAKQPQTTEPTLCFFFKLSTVFFSLKASFFHLWTESWCDLPKRCSFVSSVPEALWLVNLMLFFQQWSPLWTSVVLLCHSKSSSGAISHLCTLTLDFGLYLCESSPWIFVYHSSFPTVHSGVDLPLTATSREVGDMDLTFFKSIYNFSYRDITLLGDLLKAFTFNMLIYNFLPDLLRQLSPLLALICVQCSAHNDTKEQSDYFLPFE